MSSKMVFNETRHKKENGIHGEGDSFMRTNFGSHLNHVHFENISEDDTDSSSSTREASVHSLSGDFTFWYVGGKSDDLDFKSSIKKIGTFGCVEEFWSIYSHLARPGSGEGRHVGDSTFPSDYFLFKDWIKPLWEDPMNYHGGQWSVIYFYPNIIAKTIKNHIARLWENLILGFLGGQFQNMDQICGVSCRIRNKHETVSIWYSSSASEETINTLRADLITLLEIPTNYSMIRHSLNRERFKEHGSGLGDDSSESSPFGSPERKLTIKREGGVLEELTDEEELKKLGNSADDEGDRKFLLKVARKTSLTFAAAVAGSKK